MRFFWAYFLSENLLHVCISMIEGQNAVERV